MNTLSEGESLLHGFEQLARDIGLYQNIDETEFMSFKLNGVISIFSDKAKKKVD